MSIRSILTLVATFGCRAFAAFGGVALSLVIARTFGVDGLGAFSFALIVTHSAATFSRIGLDIMLLKKTAALEDGISVLPWLRRYRRAGMTMAILVWALISAVLLFLLPTLTDPGSTLREKLLLTCLISLPAMVGVMILVGYLRGRKRPALAALLETGGVAGLTAFITWVGLYMFGSVGIFQITLIYCVIYWGVLFALNRFSTQTENLLTPPTLTDPIPILTTQTRHFYIISLAVFFLQPGALAIGGLVLSDTDLGLLRIAERYALIISFFLSVTDPIFAPLVVKAAGNLQEIKRLFFKASALAGVPALITALLLLWQSERALSLAGPEALAATSLLYIMVLANVVNAFTGGASLFLALCGEEKYVMRVTLATFALALLGYLIGGFLLGAIGFALVYSFVLLLKNGALIVRLLCFNPKN